MDKLDKLVTDLVKNLTMIEVQLGDNSSQSFYNNQPLITDHGYGNYLDQFVNEFRIYMQDIILIYDINLYRKLERLRGVLEMFIPKLLIEKDRYNQFNNKKVDDLVDHDIDLDLPTTKFHIDMLQSINTMMGYQLDYINKTVKLIDLFESTINENKTPMSVEILKKDRTINDKNPTINPSKFLISNISPEKFLSIFEQLQNNGVLEQLSKSKLISLFEKIKFDSNSNIEELINSYSEKKQYSISENKIIWLAKNKEFSEWIWWLVKHEIILEPSVTYTEFSHFLTEIIHFTKSKPNSNVSDSIRKQMTPKDWKRKNGEIHIDDQSIFNKYLKNFIPNEDLE